MKFKDSADRTGVSTFGLAGVTILAGVIFAGISPWWLTASGLLILMGAGVESGKTSD
jgi:hypothetical protein|tara:strand:- start:2308 stop:2478 length:171 start_codon:yes stop_codon:yes gene_type:complete